MKHIVISVVAATLVSLVFNFGLSVNPVADDLKSPVPAAEKLAAEIRANRDAITLLRSELVEIRNIASQDQALAQREPSAIGAVKADELIDRLEAIEDSITRLSAGDSLPARKQFSHLEKLLSTDSVSSVELAAHYQSDFEDDSGIPLDNFSDSINETLHSIKGMNVNGVECGNTVCKVVYTRVESAGINELSESEYELEDMLAQSAEGREVEVRYAKNPYGGEVMYIQLR